MIYGVFFAPEIHCHGEIGDGSGSINNNNTNSNNNIDTNSKSNSTTNVKIETVSKEGVGGASEQYNFSINKKKVVDNTLKFGTTVASTTASHWGAGAAAGAAAAAVVKTTVGLPPVQRMAMVGGISMVAAGGTVMGIEGGKAIIKNRNLSESISDAIKNSKHGAASAAEIDRVPSTRC